MGCSQSSCVVDRAHNRKHLSIQHAHIIRKRSVRIDPNEGREQQPPASHGVQDRVQLHLTKDEAYDVLCDALEAGEPMEIDGGFSPLGCPNSPFQRARNSKSLIQSAAVAPLKLELWEQHVNDAVLKLDSDHGSRPRTVSDDIQKILAQKLSSNDHALSTK